MKRQASHNEALKSGVFMEMLASVRWKGRSWQTAGKSCCPGDLPGEARILQKLLEHPVFTWPAATKRMPTNDSIWFLGKSPHGNSNATLILQMKKKGARETRDSPHSHSQWVPGPLKISFHHAVSGSISLGKLVIITWKESQEHRRTALALRYSYRNRFLVTVSLLKAFN